MRSDRTSPAYEEIKQAEMDAPAEWNINDVIIDTYEVTGILGEGGMGKVYRVYHRNWNVDLAVKTPLPEIVNTQMGKENFIREAETWASLGLHPYIVSCYYVRILGGIPRVFAEYVDGGNLSEWIRDGRLYEGGRDKALELILDIAIQAAWGLHYAHGKGIIHQDMKPSNIMMTKGGAAKVTDFGLARARGLAGRMPEADGHRTTLATYGGRTPAYCSPEQAEIEALAQAGVPQEERPKLTRRTDIWSWAVSVLEMFAGERTWQFGQAAGTALESFLEEGTDNEVRPKMPQGVFELLRKCFSGDESFRPANMLEVAGIMEKAYEEDSGSRYPRPFPEAADMLAGSLNNMAASMYDIGRKDEAERLWQEALKADTGHIEANYNYRTFLYRMGRIDTDNYIAACSGIIKKEEKEWRKSLLLAQAYLEAHDFATAMKLLDKAAEEGRESPELRHVLTAAEAAAKSSWGLLRTFGGDTIEDDYGNDWVNSVCMSADGRYALSGSGDGTIRLWFLDWELEERQPADWDEGAMHVLDNFLTIHTPYAGIVPANREPTQEEIRLALMRKGKPTWTEEDFQKLLYTLGCAGYGWLRPEGIRRKLKDLAGRR